MTIESDLVAWVATRPDWQRDVLLRMCQSELIDAESFAERLISGAATPARTLAATDVPGTTVAGGVQLVGVHDLTGVNALAPDQQLTFGDTGLTVIYGDNASGKSGYARVLKAAVGARVREDILGDVFAASGPMTQGAVIDYRAAGADGDQQWKWPGVGDAQLQRVHFYDEASGHAYLGVESEITYRPSALILLDQLIVVCDEVRAVLERRLREVDAERASMPVVPSGTPAARFLAGLKATTTEAEITTACAVAADANEALGRLLSEEARLKASDPTKERDHLVALAGHLEVVAAHCDRLTDLLGTEGVETLIRLRSSATELRAAAAVASSQTFDAEPVTGVGGTSWRALWEAARAFSEHDAYHGQAFPVTGEGARCLLCHQILSAKAGERLQRFRRFMSDTTEREAAQAERSLEGAGQSVQAYRQVPPAVAAAIVQIRTADAALADIVDTWTSKAAQHAAAAVSWLDGSSDERPVPVGVSPAVTLSQRARQLREHAATIDAVTFAAQLNSTSEQVATLQGQLALAARKDAVVAEVGRVRRRAQIETAKKASDTGAITRKSSELTRDHVTREVRDQFTRESERLRLRRITLDSTSAVKGRLRHRPALLGAARAAAVTKVLSEGEQTALGLSGFFTEVMFAPTKSALVLDDPVTSLDHARRSLVAARLVEIARDRQVIVFTHEVTFVGDLVRHANEVKVPITERWIQRNGDVLGVCADKHPWKAKDVAARIGVLEADLAAIKRSKDSWDQEQYEEQCAAWAGKLSEAWERAVNLEIVNEVVDRGTSQVRPMKFRILAAITEQDNDEFQAGYGRCSEWARRHDKDPGINFVAPEPTDLEAELDRLRGWFKRIKAYRT